MEKTEKTGQNRCKRCNRPISDPNADYGWKCAQLVGIDNYRQTTNMLDKDSLKSYNSYVEYLANIESENTPASKPVISDYATVSKISFLPATDWRVASDIIVRNADAIKNAGAYYGVNPAIIAACIYTEQITNVNIADSLTDLPFYWADTTIGIGQVMVSTAKLVEDSGYIQMTEWIGKEHINAGLFSYDADVWYAPGYGNVSGSRERAIAHRLTVESENVNYVAAYLAYWQDRWREKYPEIDGRTAVLATLFNQGEERPPHPNPIPTKFGERARAEYPYMRQLLGLD